MQWRRFADEARCPLRAPRGRCTLRLVEGSIGRFTWQLERLWQMPTIGPAMQANLVLQLTIAN